MVYKTTWVPLLLVWSIVARSILLPHSLPDHLFEFFSWNRRCFWRQDWMRVTKWIRSKYNLNNVIISNGVIRLEYWTWHDNNVFAYKNDGEMWLQELALDPLRRYSSQLASILFHRVLPKGNSNLCARMVLQRPEKKKLSLMWRRWILFNSWSVQRLDAKTRLPD